MMERKAMQDVHRRITEWTTGEWVVVLNVLQLLLVLLFMNVLAPGFVLRTGGIEPWDLQVGYTPDQAVSILVAAGDAGRHYYLSRFLPVDVLFPLVYGAAFVLLIGYLFIHAFGENSKLLALRLTPLGLMAADYCENLGVITMILSYPQVARAVPVFTAGASLVKQVLIAVVLGLVAIGAIAWAWRVLRRSRPA